MSIIYFLILEYILILRLNLLGFFKKSPVSWSKGEKGDVILVPGFGERWIFLETIAEHLNRLGYRIHTIPELNNNIFSLDTSLTLIDKYRKKNHLQNFLFLSHSKGGVVAKYYMDQDEDSVGCLISIATPFFGTILGYLRIFSLSELIPNSSTIKKVVSVKRNNQKIINIYAKVDNHILPNKNAILPGAKNIMVDTVGHTRILEDKRTIQVIDREFELADIS